MIPYIYAKLINLFLTICHIIAFYFCYMLSIIKEIYVL